MNIVVLALLHKPKMSTRDPPQPFSFIRCERHDDDQHPLVSDVLVNRAGGGARTHTALRPLDFESSASANSATPAFPQTERDDTTSAEKLNYAAC
jgi:hypothetical protein